MKRLFFLLALLPLTFAGCKKDTPAVVQANGVRVLLFVQHHGIPISHARIFVKNGTLVFPGTDTTLYDARYVTDANGQYTISGIPNGDGAYCYYAKGIDPSWDTTHVTPVWGYQYLITSTHTGEDKDYPVSVPVSE